MQEMGPLLTDGNLASDTYTYTYDNAKRLVRSVTENGSAPQIDYGYDSRGNRTSKKVAGSRVTYEYNAANQLTKQTAGTDEVLFTYDLCITTPDPKTPEVTDPYSYNTYLYTSDTSLGRIDSNIRHRRMVI